MSIEAIIWGNSLSVCKCHCQNKTDIFSTLGCSCDENITVLKSLADLSLGLVGLRFHLRSSNFNDFTYSLSTLKGHIKKYKHLVILMHKPGEQARPSGIQKNIMIAGDLFPKYDLLNWYFHFSKNKQVKSFLFEVYFISAQYNRWKCYSPQSSLSRKIEPYFEKSTSWSLQLHQEHILTSGIVSWTSYSFVHCVLSGKHSKFQRPALH